MLKFQFAICIEIQQEIYMICELIFTEPILVVSYGGQCFNY